MATIAASLLGDSLYFCVNTWSQLRTCRHWKTLLEPTPSAVTNPKVSYLGHNSPVRYSTGGNTRAACIPQEPVAPTPHRCHPSPTPLTHAADWEGNFCFAHSTTPKVLQRCVPIFCGRAPGILDGFGFWTFSLFKEKLITIQKTFRLGCADQLKDVNI